MYIHPHIYNWQRDARCLVVIVLVYQPRDCRFKISQKPARAERYVEIYVALETPSDLRGEMSALTVHCRWEDQPKKNEVGNT